MATMPNTLLLHVGPGCLYHFLSERHHLCNRLNLHHQAGARQLLWRSLLRNCVHHVEIGPKDNTIYETGRHFCHLPRIIQNVCKVVICDRKKTKRFQRYTQHTIALFAAKVITLWSFVSVVNAWLNALIVEKRCLLYVITCLQSYRGVRGWMGHAHPPDRARLGLLSLYNI